jgi:CheY-like chemotaxis protein
MIKIMRKLIGEDIDLFWHPGKVPGPVLMDPSQLDQIMANLCINARDAIADVGRITIETGAATIDADYCSKHTGFVPGEFVLLVVSDDGYGMDKEMVDHIFEPFFTTKGVGRGTGLGLSTVYGIVKQNNGFINVYSEPGRGTTFRIYLPIHSGDISGKQRLIDEQVVNGSGETVLVVEDEIAILNLAERILSRFNYKVLLAKSPLEALEVAQAYPEKISLLLTDVVMPEMNGRELANQMQILCPGIRCLFMSGYTANVIAHRGVLDEGVNFIPKPLSVNSLAAKVREVLEKKTK